jgi:adenosyl cobinamide kinase/adenosyl cobinamide phosphate guanylyltransferase
VLTNFAIYLRHGFGFTKAFRFAFGITVRDFLLNAGLLLVILAMLTTLIMMTMDMFVTAQTQHAAEETARVKVMEGILNQCLSDATGRPVVIDNEVYLCGIVPTGVKL